MNQLKVSLIAHAGYWKGINWNAWDEEESFREKGIEKNVDIEQLSCVYIRETRIMLFRICLVEIWSLSQKQLAGDVS